MKKTTKLVLMSVLTIALCVSLIAGATFALFTDGDSVNIVVKSGKVEIEAKIDSTAMYTDIYGKRTDGEWYNGGSVFVDGQDITVAGMTPGDGFVVSLTVTNYSSVAIKYQFRFTEIDVSDEAYSLLDVLEVTMKPDLDFVTFDGRTETAWESLEAEEQISKDGKVTIDVYMPEEVNDNYQGLTCVLVLGVYAVQGNYYTENLELVTTKQELFDAIGDNAYIAMGEDIDLGDEKLEYTTTGTIDLNGNELTGAIANKGNLSITDTSGNGGTICSPSGTTIDNSGNLTLEGVTVYSEVKANSAAIENRAGATASITKATIMHNAEQANAEGWYVIYNEKGATISEISNSTIIGLSKQASLIDNWGTIDKISDSTFENTVDVIKNEPTGVIDEISGGTFTVKTGYANGGSAVLFNYGEIGEISGGEFVLGASMINSTVSPSVINNYGTINISGGSFRSETAYAHDVLYASSYQYGSEWLCGRTYITGGTFAVNPEATDARLIYTYAGLTHYAQTFIYGGEFYGEMQIDAAGPVTPKMYNIVISGGLFDRKVWSDYVGAQWVIEGLIEGVATIYDGEMYKVVAMDELTYTDANADGYVEAMIQSSNTERHTNMYYTSADEAMNDVFAIGEGYETTIDLYVSNATDVTLPLATKLTINYAVEGVKYTGTVSQPEGSSSTILKDETDERVVFEHNLPKEEATVEIVRNGATRYYANLKEAFDNAQDGDIIRVLEDHTLAVKASLTANNVTLDLNGFTVASSSRTVEVNGAQNFVIKDSSESGTGKLVCTGTSTGLAPLFILSGSTVTVTGGTFTKNNGGYSVNYTGSSFKLTITGGTFTGIIYRGTPTWLEICGGRFTVGTNFTFDGSYAMKNCVNTELYDITLLDNGMYEVTPKA